MNKFYLSIEVQHTTYGKQYNIVNKEGVILATTYNVNYAEIIRKALSTYAG